MTPAATPAPLPLDRARYPGVTPVREAVLRLRREGKTLRLTRAGLVIARLH